MPKGRVNRDTLESVRATAENTSDTLFMEQFGSYDRSKGERNDCTVRCTMAAFGVSYDDAHKWLESLGRQRGRGFCYIPNLQRNPFGTVTTRDDLLTRKVTRYYYGSEAVRDEHGYFIEWRRKTQKYDTTTTHTINSLLKELKKKGEDGTFIIGIRGHVFVIKNYAVIGNYADARRLKAKVTSIVEVN